MKINLIKIGFFIIAAVFFWRLYNLQIANGNYYYNISVKQQGFQNKKTERGIIYFTDKNRGLTPAAVNKSGFLLAINPSLIEDENKVYEKLSFLIEIDRDDFFSKAAKKNDPFEILAGHIDKDAALKIKAAQKEVKGIVLVPEKWRFYPANNLASHILGFVGYDGDELKGRYGVEKYYDSRLTDGKNGVNSNFFKNLLDIGQWIFSVYEANGASIVLTIEPILQGVLESNLEKILEKYDGLSAGGLIIDPRDGKILALAAKPDFNPNDYSKVKNLSTFVNPLVENVFEMGSIFKPLTLAAAIDQNAITSETEYVDKGYLIFNNRRIENYDGKARGKVNMQTVLNKSLNTGAVFAMQALGKEKFKSYIIDYGLNKKTEIDLPGEISGQTGNLDSGRDIEFATASFGQGIAATPIEFVAAASALANGGEIVKPYIVDKIIFASDENNSGEDKENEKIIKINPQIKNRVIKKESSETINGMLTRVVDEALLEGAVKMEHYSVAAKTGTAQLIKNEERGYSEEYLHTFFGYAPAFDPQFLIFLFLKRPVGVKYASRSLTPPFIDIVKFILNYYEIPPDR